MGDYWRNNGGAMSVSAKRPRNDIPGYLPEMPGRLARDQNPPLDPHGRNAPPPYHGGADVAGMGGPVGGRGGLGMGYGGYSASPAVDQILNQRPGMGGMDPGYGNPGGIAQNYSQMRADLHPQPPRSDYLPPDASNTLFVEGLPSDCTRREAAHIFRPFIGFKEVRLVKKESKRAGGDPFVLCFVDFTDVRCAATALEALDGYKFDQTERDSPSLKLQFAKYPAPPREDAHHGSDARPRPRRQY